ncbi:metal ABC transporter substrate-binding protein [Clostridium niameyense]|nr:zinc ABC transporter substrate-binding protein [Clostridium niameyense]
MKKILTIISICIISLIFYTYATSSYEDFEDNNVKINKEVYLDIMTTDKNLYYIVKNIVKNKHYVDYMFKENTDQYIYKFTKDSLDNISNKDLFFYVGADFEPWIEEFLGKLDKGKVRVVNASRGIKIIPYTKKVKYEDRVLGNNPYYFLNLNNYKTALANVKNAIEDKDPSNRDFYEKNFYNLLKKINEYGDQYKELSEKLVDYIFVSEEDELDYLIKYMNLKNIKLKRDESGTILNEEELRTYIDSRKDAKIVFLYSNNDILKENKDILDKYKIKPLNIKIYDSNMKFQDIVKYNFSMFKELTK